MLFACRRPEKNPIDLNNLPEECGQDQSQAGEQGLDESSMVAVKATKDTSKCRKKRNDRKKGKEECGKIYECRFCSLKFCKSQAIGGHMNRHRQEKEIETLNRARQLVYCSENLMESGPYLGYVTDVKKLPSLPFFLISFSFQFI
ncbi:zinc finger protein STAMENLESS 1-like [Magnolia sinica]|uniref:zinc finger protein STAMENLESS 1-like n=1 Tax=Magnolia sinica TaxID=86752 RepID=UPI0026596BD4|nr:zinc finger protein STAMENLESS 1-like [Magnolia sinica]